MSLRRGVETALFQYRDEIVKTVQFFPVESDGIVETFADQLPVIMMEPDAVVTDPGEIVRHRVRLLFRRRAGGGAEIGPIEADRAVRLFLKDETTVPYLQKTVFSSRGIEQKREVKRRTGRGPPFHPELPPVGVAGEDILLLGSQLNRLRGSGGRRDHPYGNTGGGDGDGGNRFCRNGETGEVETDGGVFVAAFPRHFSIAHPIGVPPVPDVISACYRNFLTGAVGRIHFDGPDLYSFRPGDGVEQN